MNKHLKCINAQYMYIKVETRNDGGDNERSTFRHFWRILRT